MNAPSVVHSKSHSGVLWTTTRTQRDFTDVVRRAVNDCDVFLSVIGTQWTTGTGVPAKVWYFQFPDNAAVDTAYAAYIRGNFTKGNCTKNRQKMDFTTTEKGKRLWTHDNLHIVNFASDSDLSFAAMKKWWEHAGPYRQP